MDYGVYTADVEEVIDFARSGRLLRNPAPPADLDLLIIHDLSQADQYREPLLDDDPSHEIPKAWIDIKCQAGTADETIQMEKLDRISSKVREALARLWERELYYDVERAVASQCHVGEIEEIAGDLKRQIQSNEATFLETGLGFHGWGVHLLQKRAHCVIEQLAVGFDLSRESISDHALGISAVIKAMASRR